MIKILTCVLDSRNRVYRADGPVLTVDALDLETAAAARVIIPLDMDATACSYRDYWKGIEPIAASLGQPVPRYEAFERVLDTGRAELRSCDGSANSTFCAEVVIRAYPGDIRMILVAYSIQALSEYPVRLTSIPIASNTFGHAPIWNEHHMRMTDIASAESYSRSLRRAGFVDAVEIAVGGKVEPPVLGSLVVQDSSGKLYISEATYRSPSKGNFFAAVMGIEGDFQPLDVTVEYFVDQPLRSVWWISEFFEISPVSQIAGIPLR
ncbi:hypothetical protein ACWDUL_08815 [Nocardia niigatensis]